MRQRQAFRLRLGGVLLAAACLFRDGGTAGEEAGGSAADLAGVPPKYRVAVLSTPAAGATKEE